MGENKAKSATIKTHYTIIAYRNSSRVGIEPPAVILSYSPGVPAPGILWTGAAGERVPSGEPGVPAGHLYHD